MVKEVITDGIWRYWIEDDSIVVYMIEAIDDDKAFAFSQSVIAAMRECPIYQPFKVIFNVSISGSSLGYMLTTSHDIFNIGVTPDGRLRVASLFQTRPDFQAYLAIVLSKAISGQKARRQGMQNHVSLDQLEGASFFDMEEAVEWLKTRL